MKSLLLVAALVIGSASQAKAASAGLVLAFPEIAGAYISVFPSPNLSIEGQVTLATVDAGLTGHIPVNRAWWNGTGSILVSALGGYVHSAVHNSQLAKQNGRFEGFVGYGFLSNGLDIRLLAGLSVREGSDAWGAAFAGKAMVGLVF